MLRHICDAHSARRTSCRRDVAVGEQYVGCIVYSRIVYDVFPYDIKCIRNRYSSVFSCVLRLDKQRQTHGCSSLVFKRNLCSDSYPSLNKRSLSSCSSPSRSCGHVRAILMLFRIAETSMASRRQQAAKTRMMATTPIVLEYRASFGCGWYLCRGDRPTRKHTQQLQLICQRNLRRILSNASINVYASISEGHNLR